MGPKSLRWQYRKLVTATAAVLGGLAMASPAWALPSFARQTGWSCATCHTSFPQLTPMGRMFKLMGYTTTNLQPQQKIEGKLGDTVGVMLPRISQFSVFVQASATNVAGGQQILQGAAGTRAGGNKVSGSNNNIEAPQQVSLFYAGALSPHVGDFLHITYAGSGGFAFDDSSVVHTRAYSLAPGNMLVVGEDVNNTPTAMDLWNTTTDWLSPFFGSDYASYGSVPTTFIANTQGANMPLVGAGLYVADVFGANRANWIYADFDAYTNSEGTGATPNGGNSFAPGGGSASGTMGQLAGSAPYLRLAYQHDWSNWNWEVGTYDMWSRVYATQTGSSTNQFNDYDIDSQLQWLNINSNDNLTVRMNWIHENQSFAGSMVGIESTTAKGFLNTFNLNATYWWHDEYAAQGGFQDTNGSANALFWGGTSLWSANGSPNSTDEWVEASYLPWWNMRFSVRYTFYNKFRGLTAATATTPSASKFNTVELLAWFAY